MTDLMPVLVPCLPSSVPAIFLVTHAGHVAIISQTAFQVTGELLIKKYGTGTRFCVWDTQLSAEKLIGADSVLRFRIEIMTAPENARQLKSTASVYKDDELVAYLENQLELVLAG